VDWGRRAPTVPPSRSCDSSGQPYHHEWPHFVRLRVAVAVADSGSINPAALLLHLSQPVVSHQVRGA